MAELSKLKLSNVKVVFFNPEDEGFGTSITIDATDPKIKKQIEDWYKENNIGKDNPGVPKFKEYTPEGGETTIQFAFKINEHTQYAGAHGLGKDDLGYGSIISLIANPFEYNNKYTGGKTRVGQSVSAIAVLSGATSGSDADLAELIDDLGEEAGEPEVKTEDIPF